MSDLKGLAGKVMQINDIGIQCDNIHDCEFRHQVIREIYKLDKYEAIRLLMHVMHVKQLTLAGAKIEYDHDNPFSGMADFEHIDCYVKGHNPDLDSLY